MYYSENYLQARERFRKAASSLAAEWPQAETWHFKVASQSDADLTVDYVYLPPQGTSRRLFVITSGLHGVEGYAGSAIQLMFLSEFRDKLDRVGTGYLLAHSLNPYGFKNGRRATENNVNLNRNFATSDELYQQKNEAYASLRGFLEPQGPVGNPTRLFWRLTVRFISQLVARTVERHAAERAFGRGQFSFPRGLEYGGAAPEPQSENFAQTVQRIAKGFPEVVLIDLHTGLGGKLKLHLIPGSDSVDLSLLPKFYDFEADKELYTYTPPTTAGFYQTEGDLNGAVARLLSPDTQCLNITYEFGTIGNGLWPKLGSLHRLILENQGFHYGYANKNSEARVRRDFLELFFPSDKHWRENTIRTAREVFTRVFARSNESISGIP